LSGLHSTAHRSQSSANTADQPSPASDGSIRSAANLASGTHDSHGSTIARHGSAPYFCPNWIHFYKRGVDYFL